MAGLHDACPRVLSGVLSTALPGFGKEWYNTNWNYLFAILRRALRATAASKVLDQFLNIVLKFDYSFPRSKDDTEKSNSP